MKDPNDHATIDGFADLVTQFEQEHDLEPGTVDVPRTGVSFAELRLLLDHVAKKSGLKRPVGRPPQGEKALTPAQKQKAYRDRKRAEKLAEAARLAAITAGEPVTSEIIDLTTDFASLRAQNRDKSGA